MESTLLGLINYSAPLQDVVFYIRFWTDKQEGTTQLIVVIVYKLQLFLMVGQISANELEHRTNSTKSIPILLRYRKRVTEIEFVYGMR